ncbi:MAG: Gfo/Idh/MocA family oxidoreductase [Phycisphaerae bacterium]|jgi:predicted dehydrogenase
MSERQDIPESPLTRRAFLQSSAIASAAALAGGCASMGGASPGVSPAAAAVGRGLSGTIRVGLIGCGGRGTGAAIDCLTSNQGIAITAMGDLFRDRLDDSRQKLAEHGAAYQVKDEHCFVGFDAYKQVLACDIDAVIMAPPPGFRPLHFKAAIDAGKHVFMEKPVAVDPVGARVILAASDLAAQKGLAVVAGTQRRHEASYVETMKRVADGAIGDLVSGQCYWNQGALWVKPRKPEWSAMEWQCRNWLYFDWLSGDHIVEQHVHNIDIINWAMGGPPVKATGMGGRQERTAPEFGNIWDHFAVEYEYANGSRVLSMCRQIPGTSERISERLVGTKGVCDPSGTIQRGKTVWKYEPPGGEWVNPYEQEHKDWIASIRSGRPLNEGRRIAESTLTAIMGRMSAYTGREISWKWVLESSTLDLSPPRYEFGELPIRPVPIPGKTELV